MHTWKTHTPDHPPLLCDLIFSNLSVSLKVLLKFCGAIPTSQMFLFYLTSQFKEFCWICHNRFFFSICTDTNATAHLTIAAAGHSRNKFGSCNFQSNTVLLLLSKFPPCDPPGISHSDRNKEERKDNAAQEEKRKYEEHFNWVCDLMRSVCWLDNSLILVCTL